MATRQYIGARYVPKFYQNSVDGSATWESNVVYEPLTYVTLTNGHMYISKKQVPATVGTPASNPDYWLDVGSYNGFIDELQEEVDDIQTELETIESKIGVVYYAHEHGITTDSLDNSSNLNALIGVASAHDGVIVFKEGVYKFNSNITLYRNVKLLGVGNVIFDYTEGSAPTFITVSNSNQTNEDITNLQRFGNTNCVMENIILMGKQEVNYPYIPTDWKNATALQVETHEIVIRNCSIKSFNIAVNYGNNAYIVLFEHCRFAHNNTAIRFVFSETTNSGEALKFDNCIMGNNKLAIYNDLGMMFFTMCSLDYNYQIAVSSHCSDSNLWSGFEKFTNCHFEDNTSAGSYDTVRFDDITGKRSSRSFVNCSLHSFVGGVYNIRSNIDNVVFKDCSFYYVRTQESTFFTGVNGAKVKLSGNHFSDRSYVQRFVFGNGGSITDCTMNTFAKNVTNGTGSAADGELTLTSNSGASASSSSGKIMIEKGHDTAILNVHYKSASYASRSGALCRIIGYDINGTEVTRATGSVAETGSAVGAFYTNAVLPLTSEIVSVEAIVYCPYTNNDGSITYDVIDVHLT